VLAVSRVDEPGESTLPEGELTMTLNPIEVVQAILAEPTNLSVVSGLVADDATYVSLNYENSDLKRLMPWAGTGRGPKGIVDTFVDVARYWEIQKFETKEIFGSGENVAVFGSLTYKSKVLGKVATSPFAIWSKVVNGKLKYMQFMEDTFATAASFRTKGVWHFESNPDGGEVMVGGVAV
jgi:hypothetical protein